VFRLQLRTTDIVRRAFELCGVFTVVEHYQRVKKRSSGDEP
jgi:hypothetical protein